MRDPARSNVHHPEYHTVTSVHYTQVVGYAVLGGSPQSATGVQSATVVAQAVPWLAPPPPIGIPSPRPMDPPDMGW